MTFGQKKREMTSFKGNFAVMVRIHTVWHRQLRRNESLGAFFFQVRVSRLESSESSALCSDVISLSSFASRLHLVCLPLRRLVCVAGFEASQSSEATELLREPKEPNEPKVLGEAMKR